jgi:hypothetical protein
LAGKFLNETNGPVKPMSSYFEQRLKEVRASANLRELAATRRKYVTRETTRHGKTVYYFRRAKTGPRLRLPDPDKVDPSVFNIAYEAALKGRRTTEPKAPTPFRELTGEVGNPGYVYFLRMGDKLKIGFSRKVGQRLRSIQTACPEPAEIVKIIPGTDQTERYFHAHFAAHRLSGEWFRLDSDLAAFVAR